MYGDGVLPRMLDSIDWDDLIAGDTDVITMSVQHSISDENSLSRVQFSVTQK